MCYINCKQYKPKKIELELAMRSGDKVDKGSVFSVRRRRMQIVLASLFVLIGLYIASGSGLLATFSSAGQAYSDVPSSHYAYEHVQRLHDEGVLGNVECPSGKFCPADSTDRKTAAVWIIRMIMDGQPTTVSNSRFSDVDAGDWKAKYIEEFAERGITSGCGDDENGGRKFCPDNNVLRKHMAIFIVRAFDLPSAPDAGFEDVRSGTYFDSINRLAGVGITTGCGDGTNFCPDQVITRVQAAIMLGRALEWRDGPLEPERDTTSPTITVRYTAGNSPSLTASANEEVTDWAHIGPLNSADCANNLFGRGTRPGSSVALDGRDNGKWYCFRAKDSANNWGFKSRQVPSNAVPIEETDTTKPVITVRYTAGNSPSLTASANEEVTDWAHIGPLNSADCANNLFGRGTRPGSSVALDGRDNGKWYCFRAKDSANNWGFKSRQVPSNAVPIEETDTTKPVITVRYTAGNSPSLTASANESVTDWAHIGPLNSADCANNLFGRGTRPGSSVALDGRDNGKWYCFRAKDSANNWGFKSRQVPSNAVPIEETDTTKPIISFAGGRVISDVRYVTFTSNEPVKWSLQHSSNKPSSCSNMSFSNAATDYTTTHDFQARPVANGLRYYCLRGVDSGGQTGYSKWYLVDQKKPIISLAVVENRLEASVEDDSGIHDILYRTFETNTVDCPKVDYSIHSHRFPTGGLDITSDLHDRWVCVRAMDDDRNKGHAGQLLVFTLPESEPTSQLQPAHFTSPAGYQPAQVVDTHYHSSNADYRQLLDDNFLLATRQSAPSEHLSFKLTTPGSFRYSLIGPDIILRGHAVHAIDYIDVSEKSGCYRELFGDGRKTSVNGLDIENQGALNSVESKTIVRNGKLPLFTFQHQQYACIKVTLWEDAAGGADERNAYKIFVTANPVEVSTAGAAKYQGMAAEDTYHNFGFDSLDFNHQGNKKRLEEHYASRFLVYATEPQVSGGRTTIDLAVNLPGKLILDHISDIERYAVKQFDFAYLDNAEDCDREAFEGR